MKNLIDMTPKILVIGDLILDEYLWGFCDRVSPEAPVQIVNVESNSYVLGGAGNVVNNLKTLGAEVDFISVLGSCETTKKLKDQLKSIDVSTKFLIVEEGRITSKKTRIISSQQQVVRFDHENTNPIKNITHKRVITYLQENITKYDVILLSDYGKGLLTFDLTKEIINIANKNNIKVLIDPKGKDYSKYKNSFLLTPNKKEASQATNIEIIDEISLKNSITKIKNDCNLTYSLITLSEHGVAVFDKSLETYPTSAREVYDVTGAGDTMLASLGFAISCKFEIDQAVQFANLAAGVVVGKIGSATVSLEEIIEYESSLSLFSSNKHIKSIDQITHIINDLKIRGKKIIFTNGCFDILHSGHVAYLEKAKEFGDILIVGINSDKSVKSLKGEERPINPERDRAYVLAALESVDFVVIFNEKTPYKLIEIVKPNILVKGGDYEGKKVVGEDIADELRLIDFVDGKSTSKTIERIKKGV